MDKVIHFSVDLPCSTQKAFDFFVKKDLLQCWLCQDAEVVEVKRGKYELKWGNEGTKGCRITALVTNELVAFDWRSPSQFAHFANQADPLTHVVVCVYAKDCGARVQLVHSGWRDTPQWHEARVWQQNAWQLAFSRLQEYLNPPAPKA